MRGFCIVVAIDEQRGIGLRGGMPWRLPGDMAYFKRITSEATAPKQNAVIMGRKTYTSIPPRFRPLPGRLNIVMSRHGAATDPGVLSSASLDQALDMLDSRGDIENIFVIGGGEIYAQAILHPDCRRLYITRIHGSFGCDTHFPAWDEAFVRTAAGPSMHDAGVHYTFEVYERR